MGTVSLLRKTCLLAALLLALCTSVSRGQQQSFREQPSDQTAIVGQTTILPCKVDHQKGDLQWTKDGFALGFDRSIPGFPRYRVAGNRDIGESDLLIQNVHLEDDAEYQCQVGPAQGDPALLGRGKLEVLVPPDQPQITNYANGSVVKVPHEQKTLQLTCMSNNGKPAATISWLRNGQAMEGATVEETVEKLANKLENSKSVLTFSPKEEDNEAHFSCQATNGALISPKLTTVQLSVMHPPGRPEIEGYSRGQIVKTGDTLKLKCVSHGGNPLAQVYWYKNDQELDFSYVSGNGRAENELIFDIQPTDNNAKYRCEASNLVTKSPLTEEITLKVYFAPEKVKISGHQNAKLGETIKLSCESSISNPPAKITWISRGQQLQGATDVVTPSDKGGFVTKSEISVFLNRTQSDIIYQCTATHDELGKVVEDTVKLEILYPPNRPNIGGYIEGREVYKGNVQTLTCTCMGGNPLATLTWWKDGKAVTQESIIRKTGNIITSHLSFLLDSDDNGATYTCNATNSATDVPLLASVVLTVNFPPASLDISMRPKRPKVGEQLTITCKSASSNPPSELSWLRDGDDIAGIDAGQSPASWGGTSTTSRLEIIPQVKDHGVIYACMATNRLLEQAVSDAVTLDVLYKPYFPAAVPKTLDVVVDLFAFLNVTAIGNPSELTYTWYRGDEKLKFGKLERVKRDFSMPHFLQDGPLLNATNVTRADAGLYIVEAENSEGKTNFTVTVNVQYPPEVTKASKNYLVDPGTTAFVQCEIDANPLAVNHIKWNRAGYNMSHTVTELSGKIGILRIDNASREDSGIYECEINNGIGEPVKENAELLVKYAPLIDQSPAFAKAAAEKYSIATLLCKAEGVPDVTFKWFRGENEIDTNLDKYETTYKKTGLLYFESSLKVHNTTKADYDKYKCVASNEQGQDERLVQLDGTSVPDAPYNIHHVNSTHDSVTLSWKPGFDGGSTQRFQVRYRELKAITENGEEKEWAYKYEDVQPPGASIYTIKELKLATDYEMTVRGINRLGEGPFQVNPVVVKTSAVAPLTDPNIVDDVPLIIILTVSILGMVLLGLNVLLILFFIRRRRKKLENEQVSDSGSQANSVEMYHAPTLTEDTKSYTTYDRKSIEGFPEDRFYDVGGRSQVDDEKRFLGPYDTDINPPPAYVSYYAPDSDYPGYNGPMDSIYNDGDQWEPRSRDPYGGSIPRSISLGPPPGETNDDEDYANQLRKMQQSIAPGPPPPGPGPRNYGGSVGHLDYQGRGRTPPPPPMRSSSKGALDMSPSNPPIPSRNYDLDDMPRYVPSPGSNPYGRPRPPPSDMRGALV